MSLQDLELKTEYRSSLDDVIKNFYTPVLKESILYKRAVGYFSSSSLIALSVGICGLIENGGKIQMIASPRLEPEDIDAINDGLRRRDDVIKDALLRELKEPSGDYEEARLNLLSNLIAAGKLEIKIAFLETNNTVGMFHDKLGLMYDSDKNIVAFSGSMNESENAYTNNYEAIDVFTSWSKDEDRVLNKQSAFNAMWGDYEPSIKVMEFPEIDEEIIRKYQINTSIDTTLDELPLYEDSFIEETKTDNSIHIPETVEQRKYQQDAINEWEKNDFRGIFDMATGTGKTYTALEAITYLYEKKQHNLAVIIICPFQHLVEQWREDIEEFGMKPIICYSNSPQTNWRELLRDAVEGFNIGEKKHFCMVATNAMFSTDYVQKLMKKLKGNIVIVVDEAHNFGAEKLSKTLLENIPYRLALSATIDRYGDPEGTQKLYDYFGGKCIEYTLKEAIDNHKLTPYYYHPVVISLNDEELNEYIELTKKIRNCQYVDKNGESKLSEQGERLLIKRARLVAGATEKIEKLREIISDYRNDNHMLVYCGATTLHDVDYEDGKAPIEEIRQIDLVCDMLGNGLNMRISKFTSEEKADERVRIREDFAEGDQLQALVAIRCLDEGVNIPNIKTAFILASSTNPKEYVQRRGRVLRTYPGKDYAVIYDFITLPIAIDKVSQYDSNIVRDVRSLAKRETIRMKDFASIAENPYESDSLIADIQRTFDIEIDTEKEDEDYV